MHSAFILLNRQLSLAPKSNPTLFFSSSSSSSPSLSPLPKPIHLLPLSIPSHPQTYANLLLQQCARAAKLNAHHPFDEIPHRAHPSEICRVLHARILILGFRLTGSLGNALVDLYAKSSDLNSVQKAFNFLEERTRTSWNSILSAHKKLSSPETVINVLESMHQSGVLPDQFTFATVLSSLARLNDLDRGRILHCQIIKLGFVSDSFCEGSLVNMYAKSGCISGARLVFDGIECPDMVSWTAMIEGCIRVGRAEEALQMFARMQSLGFIPDNVMLLTVITSCVNLGRLTKVRDLIRQIPYVNWDVIVAAHAQNGYEDEAIEMYREMRSHDVKPTESTLASVLSAAARLMALDEGRVVHSESIRLGLDLSVFVGSSLITMYAKCQLLQDAMRIFDTAIERNLVMWNAMIGGYSQNGQQMDAVRQFLKMREYELEFDEFTLRSVFGVCALAVNLELGRQLHCNTIKRNLVTLFVGNAIVDMYAKAGELNDAKRQFELLSQRDNVSWNAMITGCAHSKGAEEEAVCLFKRMRIEGFTPDEASFSSVISATSNLQAFTEGTQLHCLAIKCNLYVGSYVGSSLISMYAKLGELEAADKVFLEMPERTVVLRNALITGYVQNNMKQEALDLFSQMQRDGIKISLFTFAGILPACNGPSGLNMGKQIHCNLLKSGFLYGYAFLEVSLLCMYLSLKLEDANNLFMELPKSDNMILWTAIISGHTQNGYSKQALTLFWEMRGYNVYSDEATLSSVLKACADLASLRDGKEVHGLIIRTGFSLYRNTCSTLIDMYSKCGEITDAFHVFEELNNKEDIIVWNPMIVGFAKNGFADEALLLFHHIQDAKVTPDDVTYLGVLTACSHAGLVSLGRGFFVSMSPKHGLLPKLDHCACMIDLLGRGGYLEQAEEFIDKLPFESDGVIWATYLSACRVHEDEIRGMNAAEKLVYLEPQNSSSYMLLSSLYAASGNWGEAKMLRRAMRERGVKKSPGCSWIEVENNTSMFVAEDIVHPRAVDIYEMLNELIVEMKKEGYIVDWLLLGETLE